MVEQFGHAVAREKNQRVFLLRDVGGDASPCPRLLFNWWELRIVRRCISFLPAFLRQKSATKCTTCSSIKANICRANTLHNLPALGPSVDGTKHSVR